MSRSRGVQRPWWTRGPDGSHATNDGRSSVRRVGRRWVLARFGVDHVSSILGRPVSFATLTEAKRTDDRIRQSQHERDALAVEIGS